MSVQTRGELLATDNPENIFIRPDFHTINHGVKTVNQAPVGVTRAGGGLKPDAKQAKYAFANQLSGFGRPRPKREQRAADIYDTLQNGGHQEC